MYAIQDINVLQKMKNARDEKIEMSIASEGKYIKS